MPSGRYLDRVGFISVYKKKMVKILPLLFANPAKGTVHVRSNTTNPVALIFWRQSTC
jgi:hypothetical protein